MRRSLLDRFANWVCGLRWVWSWAARHNGPLAGRLAVLCVARCVGVPVGWRHLTGRVWITHDLDDGISPPAQRKGCRDA